MFSTEHTQDPKILNCDSEDEESHSLTTNQPTKVNYNMQPRKENIHTIFISDSPYFASGIKGLVTLRFLIGQTCCSSADYLWVHPKAGKNLPRTVVIFGSTQGKPSKGAYLTCNTLYIIIFTT
ncbi:hypothetical protein LDENG_00170240 [Lucifuga dentata]|nr:hypothetical protein LDENG_00170240 [Lucifuga dentata]